VSYVANSQLLKVIDFIKHPQKNIIVGDSRGNAFTSDEVDEITGKKFYNLSFPGCTISEALDAVDFALETTDLESIFIVTSFDFFGDNEKRESVKQAKHLARNRLAYYTSLFVTRISIRNIIVFVKKIDVSKTSRRFTDKEKNWQFAEGPSADSIFRNVKYKEETVEKLKRLKEYSDSNNIRLVFIIPPSHVDYQSVIFRHGLEKDYARFKTGLASISETVDFDYNNKLTVDKNVFGDPIHFNRDVMIEVFTEVWTRNYRIGRRLDNPIK
jgi:hypothetical protein